MTASLLIKAKIGEERRLQANTTKLPAHLEVVTVTKQSWLVLIPKLDVLVEQVFENHHG